MLIYWELSFPVKTNNAAFTPTAPARCPNTVLANDIYRAYYMAARRYEISLRMLKNISRVSAANKWNIFSTREEKFRISKRPCNVLFIIQTPMNYQTISLVFWCERHDLLCSHSNGDIFTYEDNMLLSHVKTPSFRAKAHLVFHWCLYNK